MECYNCDTELKWVSEHDANQLTDNQYNILSCLECPKCKSWVEVYYPNHKHKDYKEV